MKPFFNSQSNMAFLGIDQSLTPLRPLFKETMTLGTRSGEAKSRGWVGGGTCLFEDKKRHILAPSVLGPNLQLPSEFGLGFRVRFRVKSMYT